MGKDIFTSGHRIQNLDAITELERPGRSDEIGKLSYLLICVQNVPPQKLDDTKGCGVKFSGVWFHEVCFNIID